MAEPMLGTPAAAASTYAIPAASHSDGITKHVRGLKQRIQSFTLSGIIE